MTTQQIKYISTRAGSDNASTRAGSGNAGSSVSNNASKGSNSGHEACLSSAQAIIRGIAPDGGLYVPDRIPTLGIDPATLKGKSYQDIALLVLSRFFTDFTEEELKYCVQNAYDDKFDTPEIAPLKKAGDTWFLELYHGKTAAFKDMALSILPYLLTTALRKEKEDKKIAILTATSGDTGKAALEGFADVPGTEIIVFFPKDGVSKIQALQMTTQEGENVHVYGIDGNFDDAQTGVKNIFNDEDFALELNEKGYRLSSANSINIGRLVPQVAYYVWAYVKLLESGELTAGTSAKTGPAGTSASKPAAFNVSVPTGNFGNILAAYYAREMGIPIKKFICASNINNVLTDFFNTGEYNSRREFHVTSSPSMDILISSNLERLLYHLSADKSGLEGSAVNPNKAEETETKGNPSLISSLMKDLRETGSYKVKEPITSGMKDFYGGFADEEETSKAIGQMYAENNYLMDTHTAVGYKVAMDYVKATGDGSPVVVASTASPYKFPESVVSALDDKMLTGLPQNPAEKTNKEGFEALDALFEKTGVAVPGELKDLREKPVRFEETANKADMKEKVRESLKKN